MIILTLPMEAGGGVEAFGGAVGGLGAVPDAAASAAMETQDIDGKNVCGLGK